MPENSPLKKNPLFGSLPLELGENIRSLNPWWKNEPGVPLPPYRRWIFTKLKRLMLKGLAPATVLRGPRRVGKTVLLKQIIESLVKEGVASRHILYLPFDELPTLKGIKEPVLAITRWYEQEILADTFNNMARQGKTPFLFFDEVQNLDTWAPQIKNLVDNHAVRVMVTGSSSLRIEAGRDSLAGRIATVDLGPLLLREIAQLRFGHSSAPIWEENGSETLTAPAFWRDAIIRCRQDAEARQEAFRAFSQFGAYPIAHGREITQWHDIAAHLNETIIKRAIQHDLRLGTRGAKRDERLLEEVFRLCCRYAGQSPGQAVFVPEIRQALAGNIGWNRIMNYLKFLDGTLLIKLIPPHELRLKKKKARPKICLCDHALRASWLQEFIPLDSGGLEANPHLTDLAGHLAESALGYFLATVPNLELSYFPERAEEPEVDFVITTGTRRIPVEVKYRKRIDPLDDTRGIRSFLEKTVYNAPLGILVTLFDDVTINDPRIVPISLSSFLWLR